jgi:hypothetical protein
MPPQMRASTISSSRSESRSKCRGRPGNRGLDASIGTRSVPKKRDEERPHVADPPGRFDGRERRRHAPLARIRPERERIRRAGRQPAVVLARGEHGIRCALAGQDAAGLRPPVRDRGERRVVVALQRGEPIRVPRGQHAEGRRGGRGVLGRCAARARDVQVRLVTPVDRVDGVVHGAVDHREVERRCVGRRAGGEDGALRVEVPVDNRVALGGRRCGERGQRAEAQDGEPSRSDVLSHPATVRAARGPRICRMTYVRRVRRRTFVTSLGRVAGRGPRGTRARRSLARRLPRPASLQGMFRPHQRLAAGSSSRAPTARRPRTPHLMTSHQTRHHRPIRRSGCSQGER